MASADPQRWARVPQHLAWRMPGVPREWTKVLERHPQRVEALPGYVWLTAHPKVLHIPASSREFTDESPA